MALLYLDSCGDYYANEGILDKWRAYTVSGLSASITESGRTGKGIALGQLGGLSSIISRNLGASLRYVIGVAIKYPEGDTNGSPLIGVGTVSGQFVGYCCLNGLGKPELRNHANAIIAVDESDWQSHPATWYYVELDITIQYGSGPPHPLSISSMKMFVDGREAVTASAYSTGLSLTDDFPLGYMNIGGVGAGTIIDDIYVTTNRRHGNARVRVIRPDEDGDYLDFAGSTSPATDHFEEVNDTEEDGDSTYLESGTVGHKESHYFEDINEFSNFDVRGVQHIITAKQDVEGVRAFKSLILPEGASPATEYTPGNTHYANVSYLQYLTPVELNPATSADWTKAEVNDTQFGIEIVEAED
jgi:hypothetical protein